MAAANSNAPVAGLVSCVIARKKGGYSTTLGSAYNGATVKLKTKKLRKKGRYSVTCNYIPPTSDSVYKPSSAAGSFKVKKRRK